MRPGETPPHPTKLSLPTSPTQKGPPNLEAAGEADRNF